jgi:hypothetical protein
LKFEWRFDFPGECVELGNCYAEQLIVCSGSNPRGWTGAIGKYRPDWTMAKPVMKLCEFSRSESVLQRMARKALKLAPRGGVRGDVLILNKLSLVADDELRLEWWAREAHPWDRDLPSLRQSELFCQQALRDTEAALRRLFQMIPYVEQIDFQVLERNVSNPVILAGNVERTDVIAASYSPSIKMRMITMGVRFLMVGGHLEPLDMATLVPSR